MAKVIIFGIKDLAELAHYYLTEDSDHEVIAFCVDERFMPPSKSFKNLPVVEFEEVERIYPPNECDFFAPMSTAHMNTLREQVYGKIKSKGYKLITYISSHAVLNDNLVGDNCFILEGNVIHPFARIGNNVVLFGNNFVGHHSEIKDHVTLSNDVAIPSHCTVGENCFLGVNSTLRNGITLAKGTLVGIGSVIMKNTDAWGVYMGNPAKKIGADISKTFLKTS